MGQTSNGRTINKTGGRLLALLFLMILLPWVVGMALFLFQILFD
jgi:hypothetical protein